VGKPVVGKKTSGEKKYLMVDSLLERVVPAQFNSVRSLRRDTDAFLHESAEDRFRATVLLVVSELSTNAVEALGDDTAKLTLRVHDFTDRVEIQVSDPGPGFARAFGRPGAGANDPRGRGLQVVHSLVDEFTVHRADGVTSVCCVLYRKSTL
jgi:anti-sigma regulatory factor (Ser/Thr protein kinase)